MNLVTKDTEDMIRQAEWLNNIPPEVQEYVRDTLKDTLGYASHQLKPTDISICILATLTWVPITGWWIYTYSSVFNSLEEYNYVFRVSSNTTDIELQPNQLMVFRKHPDMSTFDTRRLECIGLTKIEQGQIFGFIRETICYQLDVEPPEAQLTIDTIWATLMWVLDEARSEEWLGSFDVIYDTATDFWAAFLKKYDADGSIPWHTLPIGYYQNMDSDSRHTVNFHFTSFIQQYNPELYRQLIGETPNSLMSAFLRVIYDDVLSKDVPDEYVEAREIEMDALYKHFMDLDQGLVTEECLEYLRQYESSISLLNPQNMVRDNRSPGSCQMCGQVRWCVDRYVDEDVRSHTFICKGCASAVEEEKGQYTDPFRRTPREKFCRVCRNTECDYSNKVVDEFGNAIPTYQIEAGKQRLESYKQYILSGERGYIGELSLQDIDEHFNGRLLPSNTGEYDETNADW